MMRHVLGARSDARAPGESHSGGSEKPLFVTEDGIGCRQIHLQSRPGGGLDQTVRVPCFCYLPGLRVGAEALQEKKMTGGLPVTFLRQDGARIYERCEARSNSSFSSIVNGFTAR